MTLLTCDAIALPRPDGPYPDGEDAYGFDEPGMLLAVSDGAGSAFASRLWARILVRRFLDDPRPALDDDAGDWLAAAGADWTAGLDLGRSPRLARKAAGGSGATLLGVAVTGTGWQAVAAGDTCLFHLREDRLVTAFPHTEPEQLDRAPVLVHTSAPTPLTTASGDLRPGDRLLVATDALARWMLAEAATDPGVWRWLALANPAMAAADLTEARARGVIADDDITLLRASISYG